MERRLGVGDRRFTLDTGRMKSERHLGLGKACPQKGAEEGMASENLSERHPGLFEQSHWITRQTFNNPLPKFN